MTTVLEVRRQIRGLGGAVICATMSDDKKRDFVAMAEKLGRQIAKDNRISFETGEAPPDETILSPVAETLYKKLLIIKEKLLTVKSS